MPWKAAGVPMLRMQFVQLVRSQHVPVARACREFGISRDTGYRWLARHDADPRALLADHSRRPHASPGQTDDAVTQAILDARRQYGWGARKLHALLLRQGLAIPSLRTVHAILARR